jgi:protein TonB
LEGSTQVAPPPEPEPAPQPEIAPAPIQVSSTIQAARIVDRVVPVYPPEARAAGIRGVVRLRAVIAPDGTIAELEAVEGHPWLVRAALAAVRQWRYRPTILNGRPVPVNTEIDVNFTLGR